jgi:GT2 family glycosyltransferase
MQSRFATCCVLSYERPEFLQQMLATMISHAAFPMEVIVHDDGSENPQVHRLLQELLAAGSISTVITNPPGHNQGQGIALNRMFAMAKGEYILKLDQDLLFQPNWLKKAIEILDENEREISAGEGFVDLGAKSDEIKEVPDIGLLGLFKYEADPVDYRKTLLRDHGYFEEHTHICGSGFVMTRRAWEEFGPFTERSEAFAEDYEMQLAVTARQPAWCCALPREDLVYNQGFGLGPSTVVVQDENGQLTSREIKKGPKLVEASSFVRAGQ